MDPVERRQVLIGAVGSTLLAIVDAQNAEAKTLRLSKPSITVDNTTIDLLSIRDVSVNKAKEADSWKELVTRIAAADDEFKSFDKSFEKGVVEDLKKIASEELNSKTHNLRLVEPLLGEIASLVDRCITYRREGSELEVAGVAAAATRLTYDALNNIDRQIATMDVVGSAAAILANEYGAAVLEYEKAIDKNLGVGNALQLKAQVDANTSIASGSHERVKLILSRLVFTQEIDRQLLARHKVDGNAHNFPERFERLRMLFESDIKAAYRRAIAAYAGLMSVFEFTDRERDKDYLPPVPAISESGFVDSLLIWTREAMRAVTKKGEVEQEYSKVISVSIPAVSPTGASFTVKLEDAMFAGLKSIRLRSIAASYCLEGGDFKNDLNGNGVVGLVLVKSERVIGPPVVVVNPAVRQWGSQNLPSSIEGALIYNLDPKGTWTGRLNAKGISGNGTTWDRAGTIKSLILQFRVLAVLEKNDGTFWTGDRV